MVNDDGHVLMVFAVAKLVNTDMPKPIETVAAAIELTVNDPVDDRPYGPPGGPKELRYRRPTALLCEESHPLFEGVREIAAVLSPFHTLGLHVPACQAVDAADHVLEVYCHPGEIKVSPATAPTILHSLALDAALTTARELAAIGGDFDNQPRLLKVEPSNDEVLDGKENLK